jgi:3-deoxy-D-manno-octulosonic-acid transferase
MNLAHFAYNLLGAGLALLALPAAWCFEKRSAKRLTALAQRLGYGLQPVDGKRPLIWIHAVSVGEVKAAETVARAMEETAADFSLLLTTTTHTGQQYAREQLQGRANIRYAPVDLWWVVARFLNAYRPDLLVCMETEIWPNWIAKAHQTGIKSIFLNGRISRRTIRSYRRLRPLIAPILKKVDAFSMISPADAQRIIRMGAPAGRVQVNGNVKNDALDSIDDGQLLQKLKQIYAIGEQIPVFAAGSVRGAENQIILDVYFRLKALIPELVCIAAPRHIDNAVRIAAYADIKGIAWQYRTDLEVGKTEREAPLVILNTIGELRTVYGLASVVFCGGSLVPLGGQNVLEPAMWAKPVLFGPFMEDFQEAGKLLEESGGGRCVPDAEALIAQAGRLLTHPDEADKMGRLARRAVQANQGAGRRHAKVIADILQLQA